MNGSLLFTCKMRLLIIFLAFYIYASDSMLMKSKDGFKKPDYFVEKNKLETTADNYKGTQAYYEEISMKNVSHYRDFTDFDRNEKAFFIPLIALKEPWNFDDSMRICKNFNSTLIEYERVEKQVIVESYLGRLEISDTSQFNYIQINAKDQYGYWVWLNSGKPLTFGNWRKDYPIRNYILDSIVVPRHSIDQYGKWSNVDSRTFNWVV